MATMMMMMLLLLLLWFGACTGSVSLRAPKKQKLLRESPMIMAHDAGTTYLPEKASWVAKEVLDWTRTQPSGGFGTLLDCGVRAFDVRTKVDHGKVFLHHGPIEVHTELSHALEDVKNWSSGNGNKEVVVLYMSHFVGDVDLTLDVLKGANIATFSDSTQIRTLTYRDALKAGPIIAIVDNVVENYDPSIICEQAMDPHFICWQGKENSIPMSKMESYLENTSLDPSPDKLWMLQAHWQSNPASVIYGTLLGSSIMEDNAKSDINRIVLQNIQAGKYPNINFLELNNVCNAGPEIYLALKKLMSFPLLVDK